MLYFNALWVNFSAGLNLFTPVHNFLASSPGSRPCWVSDDEAVGHDRGVSNLGVKQKKACNMFPPILFSYSILHLQRTCTHTEQREREVCSLNFPKNKFLRSWWSISCFVATSPLTHCLCWTDDDKKMSWPIDAEWLPSSLINVHVRRRSGIVVLLRASI